MFIELPSRVKEIISKLESAGFEAYVVGGCVRDSILGRRPEDWDITTSAKPNEVKSLFRTVDTGIKHGTVTVLFGKNGYEVTTFRIDGDYSDLRHPDKVSFTSSLLEDLKRRDFTINAMAYSERTGLVDEFSGLSDLESHVIRSVGDPKARFSEDALRMLRAIRFAGQLNFKIEANTLRAINELSSNIAGVSAERIAKELEKLLVSKCPSHIRMVFDTNIFKIIMPDVDKAFADGLMNEAIANLERASYSTEKELFKIRLAIFLEPIGAENAHRVLKGLKLDNDTINSVRLILKLLKRDIESDEFEMRKTLNVAGEKILPLLLETRRSKGLEDVTALYNQVLERGDCTSVSGLAINGNDLINLGVPKGIAIGEILNRLLELVIKDPTINNRERLLLEVKINEK